MPSLAVALAAPPTGAVLARRARGFMDGLHRTWLRTSHRLASSPLATLVATALAWAWFHPDDGAAFVDWDTFRLDLPTDLSEVAQAFLADPESGAHPISALLVIGKLHRMDLVARTDVSLPRTTLETEAASRSAAASGIVALGKGNSVVAAHHFHLLAAIDSRRDVPPGEIALAYALRTLALLDAGNLRDAKEAQRHWERLQRQAKTHPGGPRSRRRLRARATLLAQAGECLALSDCGDRALRLGAAHSAYLRARDDYRALHDTAAIERVEGNLATLEEMLAAVAAARNEAPGDTAPDPDTQQDLVREAALIRATADGPLGEAAEAAVQFFLLRTCTVADRDEALARWEQAFFTLYPEEAELRRAVPAKYRTGFLAAYCAELLCYALIPRSLRPFMNDAVALHAEFLRVTHETLEASSRLACPEGDGAALLIRLAALRRLLEETLAYYVRAGYGEGVARLEALREPLDVQFTTHFREWGRHAYQVQQRDEAEWTATVVPWVTAYLILHPQDLRLRQPLAPLQQQLFDRALLAEQVGNDRRMMPDVEALREAHLALRHAHIGFTHLKLRERAARLDPLLRGLERDLAAAGAKDAIGHTVSGVFVRPHVSGARARGSGAAVRPSGAGARVAGRAAPAGDDDFATKARSLMAEALRGPNQKKPE